MDITLHPGKLHGTIAAISSKSVAHRILICAAFADAPTQIRCGQVGADVQATIRCLQALGASITQHEDSFLVIPVAQLPQAANLPCGESGSTLRFLLPVVGALGVEATFQTEGRLPHRPLSPLWEEMERMGCQLSRPTEYSIVCRGKLQPGIYHISGGVSSQFLSGLQFAFWLMDGACTLQIEGRLVSEPYLHMTHAILDLFGPKRHSPGALTVEGDWSNGAFWWAANALGSNLSITGLEEQSLQGDRAIADCLAQLEQPGTVISAAQIPDLIPILSVVAAAKHGAIFTDIDRLRLKESDRVRSILEMIHALGGNAQINGHQLQIFGTGLRGGTVFSHNDHRIAMSAAIASTVCTESVTILGSECVEKSYPKFWDDFLSLQ